jgi:hypothetical protein
VRLEELLRHLHNEPAESRPPLGTKPTFHRTTATISNNTETRANSREAIVSARRSKGMSVPQGEPTNRRKAQFDIDKFKELRDFAYSTNGLNLSTSAATQWAEEHLCDEPSFNVDEFVRLRDFAYNTSGLDMSTSNASQWALEHVSDVPSFDAEQFMRLKDFAYSTNGLDLSSSEATQWALAKMNSEES